MTPNTKQPPPQPSTGDCWLAVISDASSPKLIADMRERRDMGIRKHGTPLQPNNGRDAVVDCYQEVLDSIVYCKQAVIEGRDGMLSVYRSLLAVAGELREIMEIPK